MRKAKILFRDILDSVIDPDPAGGLPGSAASQIAAASKGKTFLFHCFVSFEYFVACCGCDICMTKRPVRSRRNSMVGKSDKSVIGKLLQQTSSLHQRKLLLLLLQCDISKLLRNEL